MPLSERFATPDEIARLDALTSHDARASRSVAVAFSGGGDSAALLAIARDWADVRGATLIALHVDHGLRADSAVDAETADACARALGVAFAAQRWSPPPLVSGVQAAARAARHRLLARACAARSVGTLLLGHTLDDQAETVFMRLGRAPARTRALAGLAALAPSPAWPEGASLPIARPLLTARRAELRARLARAGIALLDDPSNADMTHERVRARAALADFGANVSERLACVADLAQGAERARRAAARRPLQAVQLRDGGAFELDRAGLFAVPAPARALLVEALATSVAGAPGPLAPEPLARLLSALDPGRDFSGATLGGAVFEPAGSSRVVIARDPGAVLGRADGGRRSAAPSLQGDVWDGRFRIDEALGPDEKLTPAQGLMAKLSKTDRARLKVVPAAARGTAPVILGAHGPVRLASGVFMASQALARRMLPEEPLAWCDDAAARAALGFPPSRGHMECRCTAAARGARVSDEMGKTHV